VSARRRGGEARSFRDPQSLPAYGPGRCSIAPDAAREVSVDALRHVGSRFLGVPRIVPAEQDTTQWAFFFPEKPEHKDYAALDFVVGELNLLLRSEGETRAQIEHTVLVERAVAKGIQRHNIEVAITCLVMAKQLVEKDSILRFA
jgi:hypothetical protein